MFFFLDLIKSINQRYK